MCYWTFWNDVKPNAQYKQMWRLVRQSFIWIDCVPFFETVKKQGDNGKKATKVMKRLQRKYQSAEGKMTCYNWGDNGCSLYAKGSIYASIRSKTGAKALVSDYIATTKKLTSHIYSFLRKDDGGTIIENKSMKKVDIYFLCVRYVEEAWGGDVIEPAVNAAFNTSRAVDPHFQYTLKDDDGDIENEDDDSVNSEIGSTGGDIDGCMGDVDDEDDMF